MDLLELLNQGALNLTAGELVLTLLVLTHVTVVSVTIYFHRFSAHRALDLHPLLQHFFRFWLWLATGMVTKEWTAVHRKHHALCETPEDPHSPQVQGLSEILWRQTEAYQRCAAQPDVLARYGRGTPDDWIERNLYTRHSYLGVSLLLVLYVYLFGLIGITMWAIQVSWIPLLGGVINGIGHYWGYRNFEVPDASRNIVPWGILIGGEELHNNHHTYPNSAKLSVKRWEVDEGWFWIRLFQLFGLARPLSTGPVVLRQTDKAVLDTDTALALVNDRFNVMAQYADQVIAPTVKAYRAQIAGSSDRVLRRAKALLCRQELLLSDSNRDRLQTLMEVPEFRTVYELRLKLQSIWEQRTGDMEELLKALKQWCADAEATGSRTLTDFVCELRSYTLPKSTA